MCQKWFAVFRAGDFSLDNAPWLGRTVEVDNIQIKTVIKNNQHYTMWEVADILKMSKSTIKNHSHQFGYDDHFDVWVPHELN